METFGSAGDAGEDGAEVPPAFRQCKALSRRPSRNWTLPVRNPEIPPWRSYPDSFPGSAWMGIGGWGRNLDLWLHSGWSGSWRGGGIPVWRRCYCRSSCLVWDLEQTKEKRWLQFWIKRELNNYLMHGYITNIQFFSPDMVFNLFVQTLRTLSHIGDKVVPLYIVLKLILTVTTGLSLVFFYFAINKTAYI